MNSNLAPEWILDQHEAWEIKVPQQQPPVVIELGDEGDDLDVG